MSHLLALALLGVDCLVRAWRIQLAVWTAGGRLSFNDAFRLNLYGEAASQLTPNRLGGEPARFLGLAEAGLIPGVVVYLHEWFPARYRARALGRFFIASSVALAIGGPIAGLILRLNWSNLPGWRWLFILEGIPAVALAVVTIFAMADRPQAASWLTAAERQWIATALAAEKQRKLSSQELSIWATFGDRDVMLLSAVSFLANIGISGFFLWLPTTLRNASTLTPSAAAALSGVPFASAVASVLFMSYSSDRSGERRLHTAIPLILAAFIFPVTTLSNLSFAGLVIWLISPRHLLGVRGRARVH